jgi:hypothetical protein
MRKLGRCDRASPAPYTLISLCASAVSRGVEPSNPVRSAVPDDKASRTARADMNSNSSANFARFATTVASGHATLATKRTLLLTWVGLPPAGSRQRYLAPSTHSITSSVRASSVGGTSRPSAFAVFKLTTSSNLTRNWTGRSLGFSPLKILST